MLFIVNKNIDFAKTLAPVAREVIKLFDLTSYVLHVLWCSNRFSFASLTD